MQKYTVVFKNGEEMTFTKFKNRIDVYNYVCANQLAKGRNGIKEILVSVC